MSGATSTSPFDKLLGELEIMHKAIPAAGADVAAAGSEAAADGGEADAGGEGGEGGEGGDAGAGDEGGEGLAKSFEVTLANGEKVQAQDGTELVKSLMARLDSSEGLLAKALGQAVDLLKAQGAEITSLREQVGKLSAEGRGRKTVLSVTERPAPTALQKAEDKVTMTPEQFLVKATDAMANGRITGREVALAEAHINRGQPVPQNIIERVVSQ